MNRHWHMKIGWQIPYSPSLKVACSDVYVAESKAVMRILIAFIISALTDTAD